MKVYCLWAIAVAKKIAYTIIHHSFLIGSLQDYVEELSRNNQKLDEFRIWNVINDLSKVRRFPHLILPFLSIYFY